jgi:hypothetical protein
VNYLDPICVDADGCLGLTTYAIDLTHAPITLTDDPDRAELGKPAPRRDHSSERSLASSSPFTMGDVTARDSLCTASCSRRSRAEGRVSPTSP